MRIGVIGPQEPDNFADNICNSLTAMGVDNVRLGAAQGQPRSARVAAALDVARRSTRIDERLQRRVARYALERECTAVLTVEGSTSPAVVSLLRSSGVSVALWFPDHIANLGRLRMLLAPYTAMFFKEPRLVDRLTATLGVPAYYLPEACNPRWHQSTELQGIEPVVVVAGNMYPSRLLLVGRLLRAGVPLVLYGGGFPRWVIDHPALPLHTGRYIVRQEKANIFRRAAAVLNNLHPGEVDGVNCRLFEATGSGAVVLAEDRPVLSSLFESDELFAWSTFDELVDRARTAVTDAGSFAAVGDRAAQRAHRDHTYEQRLATIIQHLV
jgi:spore maturation protein CgeB